MKPLNNGLEIGLLAMSGVRVCDEELLRIGLTLPAFVSRSKVVASLPSLSLLYLASVTPPGCRVRYFEATTLEEVPPELYTCDLVAISTFSAQALEAYKVADDLRARGVTVAMGGLHVSACPQEAFTHADHVVVGEGENVWPHVVKAVENGEEGRIWNANEYGIVDLDRLPVPRYELLVGREHNRFTVQTSRGCPWRCEFCASSIRLSPKYRKRPVDNVIRDILELKHLFGEPYLEFADDNTFVDKVWGKELLRKLTPLQLKWFTETDISLAEDEELLQMMADAGCRQVLIGLESPAQSALEGLELQSDFKARTAPSYREDIAKIQSYGITVNGCFILGLDHQTTDVFQEVLDFADDVGLYESQATVLTPFPGTELYTRLQAENRLIDPTDWSKCTLFDVNYTPKQMSVEELREGLYFLTENLYNSSKLAERRRKFFANLRKRVTDVGLDFGEEVA